MKVLNLCSTQGLWKTLTYLILMINPEDSVISRVSQGRKGALA